MAREDLHFRLRIPQDLKGRIEAWADLNQRSMTAEIVARLYDSVNDDSRARLISDELDKSRQQVADLEKDLAKARASQVAAVRALTSSEDAMHALERLVDAKEETQIAMRQNIGAMSRLIFGYEQALNAAAHGDRTELDRLIELQRKQTKEENEKFLALVRENMNGE